MIKRGQGILEQKVDRSDRKQHTSLEAPSTIERASGLCCLYHSVLALFDGSMGITTLSGAYVACAAMSKACVSAASVEPAMITCDTQFV